MKAEVDRSVKTRWHRSRGRT